MYLKSLTLKGFKSFASSTTLQLEPGITCIVGPNGSGKSNVVDALAWVMGEQGAKSLRGGKMEDVIFAGTSGRPPLGRAEVALTIDNADGALPIEYAEVTISRTMFRNGGSEYAINGSSCRLLDVQELLSDSGIGREMHVIVGQGQLDSILHATPEDRRGFIEEAAGVLKHRKRKEKALRKLDSTEGNLTRLADLLSEIRRQLKPLGRQAEVARRAQGVQADVRDARARLMADDLATARAALEQELADESVLVERRAEVEAALAATRETEAALEAALREDLPALSRAQETWFGLSGLRERLRGTAGPGGRAGPQRRLAAGGARGPRPRRARGPGRADARAGGADRRRGRRPTGRRSRRPWPPARPRSRPRPRRSAGSPGCSVPPPTVARAWPACTARSTGCAAAPPPPRRRSAGSPRPAPTPSPGPTAPSSDFTSLESRVAGLDAGEEGLDAEHEAASALLADLEERLAKTREEVTAAERERSALTARKEALELGLNRKDGAGALLAATDPVTGLLGSVAALLSVRAGYEAAVAAALGSAADAVAVSDVDAALGAIAHLKDDDLGRAGILLGGADLPAREAPPGRRPVHRRDVRRRRRGVPRRPAARRWSACSPGGGGRRPRRSPRPGRATPDVTAVTRDGDVLGAHFAAGGSTSQPSLIEVQAAVDEAAEQLSAAAHTLRAADLRRRNPRARARGGPAPRRRGAGQAARVRRDPGRGGRGARPVRLPGPQRPRPRRPGSTRRSRRPRSRATRTSTAWPSSRRGWPRPRTRPRRSPTPPSASGSPRPPGPRGPPRWRPGWRCAPPRSGPARSTAAPTACCARPAPSARRAPALARREQLLREGRVGEAVGRGVARVLARLEESIALAAAERTGVEQARAGREQELRETRVPLRDLGRELDELVNTVHRDEMARTQQRMRIEQLEEKALEELGLDPDGLVADYGPDQLVAPVDGEVAEGEEPPAPVPFDREEQTKRLRTAERALAQLGRINPLALEEFSALEERHKFLTEQLEDLKSTRKDLLDIVREVDDRVEQVFTEAYADVSTAFDATFARLFPGGEGRLVLTDPDDMLTTGIEVEARPAGKKVKRLSLLSGGERSLVAVAFLVSLFKARPSPFYILDEVEAALDDTNLGRLLQIYEELRENSQLLVITHQKRTMEVGDALYGVTMRGDGVSAVISQRLREQESA